MTKKQSGFFSVTLCRLCGRS